MFIREVKGSDTFTLHALPLDGDKAQLFEPEMGGFGSKISYTTENHSLLSQNL